VYLYLRKYILRTRNRVTRRANCVCKFPLRASVITSEVITVIDADCLRAALRADHCYSLGLPRRLLALPKALEVAAEVTIRFADHSPTRVPSSSGSDGGVFIMRRNGGTPSFSYGHCMAKRGALAPKIPRHASPSSNIATHQSSQSRPRGAYKEGGKQG